MSRYITQKPGTIEEEIEFTQETKESAAHFSLALDRGAVTAASKRPATAQERKRLGAEA